MDWKTFIATMTGNLAWPLTALVLGLTLMWLLRHHVAGLVARLQELTLPGGIKLTLTKELEKGRDQSEAIAAENPSAEATTTEVPTRIVDLARDFPEAAILEAYKQVESEIIKIRQKLEIQPRSNLPTVMRELVRRELLGFDAVEFFDTLRRARNSAAHPGERRATPGEAIEYAEQAAVMLAVLRGIPEQLDRSAAISPIAQSQD